MGAMVACASSFHAIGLPPWTLGLRQAPGSPASLYCYSYYSTLRVDLQILHRACPPPFRPLPPGPTRARACIPGVLAGGVRVCHSACHGCGMASYELIEDRQMILT